MYSLVTLKLIHECHIKVIIFVYIYKKYYLCTDRRR